MRQFKFFPCYYEWHLTDANTDEVLFNLADPIECCYNSYEEPLSLEELEEDCRMYLDEADIYYATGLDYNGILLSEDKALTKEEMNAAAKIMAEALYNYYIK